MIYGATQDGTPELKTAGEAIKGHMALMDSRAAAGNTQPRDPRVDRYVKAGMSEKVANQLVGAGIGPGSAEGQARMGSQNEAEQHQQRTNLGIADGGRGSVRPGTVDQAGIDIRARQASGHVTSDSGSIQFSPTGGSPISFAPNPDKRSAAGNAYLDQHAIQQNAQVFNAHSDHNRPGYLNPNDFRGTMQGGTRDLMENANPVGPGGEAIRQRMAATHPDVLNRFEGQPQTGGQKPPGFGDSSPPRPSMTDLTAYDAYLPGRTPAEDAAR